MSHPTSGKTMTAVHDPNLNEDIADSIRALFEQPLVFGVAGVREHAGLIVSSNASGMPQLYYREGLTGEQRALTDGPEAVTGPFAMHPSGRALVFVRDRGGDGRHHVYLLDVSTGEQAPLGSGPIGTLYHLFWADDGHSIVAVGYDQQSVFARLLRSGGHMQDIYTTDRQIFCADIDNARSLVALAVGRGPGTEIVLADITGVKEPRTIEEPADTENTLPAVHSKRGLVAYINRTTDGRQHLVVRDIATLQERGRFAIPATVGDADFMVSKLLWMNDTSLLLTASHHARVDAHLLDMNTSQWARLPAHGSIHEVTITAEGVIAVESGLGHPDRVITLSDDEPAAPDGASLPAGESHWYESFDGRRVQGWLVRAARDDAPLVVYCHGGPSFFTGDSWDPYIQSLALSGFHVFAPNFRGSTSFGAAFRDLNLGDVGGGDLQDVLHGARYASELLGLQRKPAIVGGSYGGYLTLHAMTTQSEEWAGGVALVPISDWRESYELANAHYRRFAIHFMGGTPDEKPELYRDRSPLTHVANLKAPLLIIHGENDPICPIQPVRRFVDKATQLGRDIRMHVAEDAGHGSVANDQAIIEVVAMIEHLRRVFH